MSLSRVAAVLFSCLLSAVGTVAGGDLASGAPSGAQLQLTGISPAAGPLAGGNAVTIRADDAHAVTSVDFGAVAGGQISHDSAHQLRVLAPAHDAGTVDVVLHSASATSPVTPAGRYAYVAPPEPFELTVSQRLGSELGVGLLDAIGCTLHDFCAAEMRNRAGQVTALATFGDGHPTRVQRLPDKPLLRPACTGYCPSHHEIACGTPRFCIVGNGQYLRVWNGDQWGEPLRPGRLSNDVLSCAPGTTLCVLVGGDDDSYVHDQDGWRTVPFPDRFPYPHSVSCATAHFCVAGTGGPPAVFDGSSWHLVSVQPPFLKYFGCASAHYCLGVGRGHAVVFDGTHRHVVASAPAHKKVHGVSCIAVGRCVASTATSAEIFTHGMWTVRPTPLRITASACVPHGICRATFANGQALRLAHHHWTHTEDVTAYHDVLTDISCASPTWCQAVSRSGEAFQYSDGTWSREGHVDGRHRLVAISCTADRVCVAVDKADGTAKTGVFSGGRAVRYSHGSWHRPVVIDTGHRLIDVSCPSATQCVAVETDRRTITYRHGTWTEPTRLPPGPKHGIRYTDSIDCPTVHYCATTGYPSYELVDGTWREINFAFPTETAGIDCINVSYCVFGDTDGLEVRNHRVIGSANDDCCYPQTVSCASRSYCAAVFDNYAVTAARSTYLFNGAAYRHLKRLSHHGHPGAPVGIACFTGPVCIGVTAARGFVGR